MKNRIFLLSHLIFIFSLSSFSQANLIKEKVIRWNPDSARWLDAFMYIYEYDSENRLKSQDYYVRPDSSLELIYQYTGNFFYDNNGNDSLIATQIWNSITQQWQTLYQQSKHFNDNNCLVVSENLNFFVTPPVGTKTIYEYEEDCHIISQTNYQKASITGWTPINKSEFFTNASGTRKDYEMFLSQSGEWVKNADGYFEYDELGRPIVEYKNEIIGTNNIKTKTTWYYNETNTYERIEYLRKVGSSEWENLGFDSIVRVFNERQLLLTESSFKIPQTGIGLGKVSITISNEYYCDGLIKEQRVETFSPFHNHQRTIYEYDNLANCEKNEDKIHLDFYPNPATNFIQIQSSLLTEETSEISLFTVTGILVLKEKPTHRTNSYQLNINDLSTGTYIIKIKNKYHSKSKKLMIW